nr:hypothetical protein [Peristeroidobacter agariperforans]
MSIEIVFPAIQQILEMKTGFRFSPHHQAALKEQCVGILLTQRQGREVRRRPSHRDMWFRPRSTQSEIRDLERQGDRHILDLEAEAAPGQLDQAICHRLPSQQVIHHRRYDARGQRLRNDSQNTARESGGMQHACLQQSKVPFCHIDERSLLIRVKRISQ